MWDGIGNFMVDVIDDGFFFPDIEADEEDVLDDGVELFPCCCKKNIGIKQQY